MTAEQVATFLFTDLVGSSSKWERDRTGMSEALARHDEASFAAVERAHGTIFKHGGDGICASFDQPRDAVLAAVELQRALTDEPLLQVRAGIHLGPAEPRAGDWFGPTVNRCARLMSVAHGGQILVSHAVAAMLEALGSTDVSIRELGTVRLRGLAEPEVAHQVVAVGLLDDFPPLVGQVVDNLPPSLTTFIGRASELAEIESLLGTHGLVTLVGVGGTGKTRVAIEAARVTEQPDGVLFAALADASDQEGVCRVIADAARLTPLGAASDEASDIDVIRRGLARRRALLVLDNCEHVLDPVAEVVSMILGSCTGMRVLATSREPIGVAGEQVWRVPTLDETTSVDLLVQRAQAGGTRLLLAPDERQLAVEVCRRLDGLPLAIELAAARLRVMSVAELGARLEDRFALLAGRGRRHDRHATLRAAMDWSYHLLDEHERLLLDRLSIFVGGFTLDGAEAVCAFGELETGAVLDLLESLVDKSLVVVHRGEGATRYTMLETVRQYAAECLARREETLELEARHETWMSALAINDMVLFQANADHPSSVMLETDNARAALEWAIRQQRATTAQSIACMLAAGLTIQGRCPEALRWCEAALAIEGEATPARYFTECVASYSATFAGAPVATAWEHGLRALAMAQADQTLPEHLAWATLLPIASEDPPPGAPTLDECLERFRSLLDPASPGFDTLQGIALASEATYLMRVERAAEAVPLMEQAFALIPASSPNHEHAINWLALAQFLRDGATGLTAEQVHAARTSTDPIVVLQLHVVMSVEAAAGGAAPGALLDDIVELGERCCVPLHYTLDAATALVAASGDAARAARMYGVARPTPPVKTDAWSLARCLRPRVEAALGTDQFEALVSAGARLSPEAAIALTYEV